MDKILNRYETIIVSDLTNGEDAARALLTKFTTLISDNGNILSVDEWGKRRLAYPINDMNEGYYVLVTFESEASFVTELERVYGITEGVMRSMVVRIDEKRQNSNSKKPMAAEKADSSEESAESSEEVVVEAETPIEEAVEAPIEEEAEISAEEVAESSDKESAVEEVVEAPAIEPAEEVAETEAPVEEEVVEEKTSAEEAVESSSEAPVEEEEPVEDAESAE